MFRTINPIVKFVLNNLIGRFNLRTIQTFSAKRFGTLHLFSPSESQCEREATPLQVHSFFLFSETPEKPYGRDEKMSFSIMFSKEGKYLGNSPTSQHAKFFVEGQDFALASVPLFLFVSRVLERRWRRRGA